jgi:hypothetical protein
LNGRQQRNVFPTFLAGIRIGMGKPLIDSCQTTARRGSSSPVSDRRVRTRGVLIVVGRKFDPNQTMLFLGSGPSTIMSNTIDRRGISPAVRDRVALHG